MFYLFCFMKGNNMGRKKKKKNVAKTYDITKVELSDEEYKKSKLKVLSNTVLSITWPLSLLIIVPNIRGVLSNYIYYFVLIISIFNIIATFLSRKLEVDEIKYHKFLLESKLKILERFSNIILIIEVLLIFIYLVSIKN